MRIQEVSVCVDFKTDESYTPQRISIQAGNSFYQLQEIKQVDFDEPVGWYTFRLFERDRPYIKTMELSLVVL